MFRSNESFKLAIPRFQREVTIKPINGFPSVMVHLDKELNGMKEFGVSLIGDVVPEADELTHIYNEVKTHMKYFLNQQAEIARREEKQLTEMASNPLKSLARDIGYH